MTECARNVAAGPQACRERVTVVLAIKRDRDGRLRSCEAGRRKMLRTHPPIMMEFEPAREYPADSVPQARARDAQVREKLKGSTVAELSLKLAQNERKQGKD